MTPRTPSPKLRQRGAVPKRRALHARGAAYVEAILVVIFMTIIFVGVTYLGNYFDAKQRALSVARQCAWAYSKNACVDDRECGQPGHYPCLPEVCAEALGTPLENEPNADLAASVAESQATAQGLDPNERVADDPAARTPQQNLRAGVEDKMGPMMEMLVGESLVAVGSQKIPVPSMVPTAQSQISASYWLPCNLRHHDAFDVAMDLFFSLFGGGGL